MKTFDLPVFDNGGGLVLVLCVMVALGTVIAAWLNRRRKCHQCGHDCRHRCYYASTASGLLVGPYCRSECVQTASSADGWPFGDLRNIVILPGAL